MKSVGETMAIGRTFRESFQKALRGLEIGHFGLGGGKKDLWATPKAAGPKMKSIAKLSDPQCMSESFYLRYAMKMGDVSSRRDLHDITDIDPWFLR